MGLFSKKEACPVCGGEVKGLFLVKIADKKTLCKNCSKQVSMNKALLETATPEFMKEHLEYRRKNAEKYASHTWEKTYTSIPGLKMGLDEAGKAIYLIHDDLHVDDENPVVLSFDQITGYELYRRKKQLDNMDETGSIPLETGMSVLSGIARLSNQSSSDVDYFMLKLTTTDPYWENLDLKITFSTSQLHGIGGFARDMQEVCQIIKSIIRKEPLSFIQ